MPFDFKHKIMSFIWCHFKLKDASHFIREPVNEKSQVAKKWHRFLSIHLFLIYFVTESINFGLVKEIGCFWFNELWYFYKSNYCRFIFTHSEHNKRKKRTNDIKKIWRCFSLLSETELKISCDIINTSVFYIYSWSGLWLYPSMKRYNSFHIRF